METKVCSNVTIFLKKDKNKTELLYCLLLFYNGLWLDILFYCSLLLISWVLLPVCMSVNHMCISQPQKLEEDRKSYWNCREFRVAMLVSKSLTLEEQPVFFKI